MNEWPAREAVEEISDEIISWSDDWIGGIQPNGDILQDVGRDKSGPYSLDNIRERVQATAQDWAELNFDSAPELGPTPAPNNSDAFKLTVPIVLAGAMALFATIFIAPYMLLVFPIIAWPFWLMGRLQYTSPEKAEQQHRSEWAQRVSAWEKSRSSFVAHISDELISMVIERVRVELGVPERLKAEFSIWMIQRSEFTRTEIALEVSEWASQPEFPPAPSAAPEGVSHEEYENYCRLFLHSWGYLDAEVTRFVKDGGIDVESKDLVVQCKHITGNVRAPEIQAIFGIAAQKAKQAVVFSAGGFTKDAIAFANRAGVALFSLREEDGRARALNPSAREIARKETSLKGIPAIRNSGQGKKGLMSRMRGRLGEGPRSIDELGNGPV